MAALDDQQNCGFYQEFGEASRLSVMHIENKYLTLSRPGPSCPIKSV